MFGAKQNNNKKLVGDIPAKQHEVLINGILERVNQKIGAIKFPEYNDAPIKESISNVGISTNKDITELRSELTRYATISAVDGLLSVVNESIEKLGKDSSVELATIKKTLIELSANNSGNIDDIKNLKEKIDNIKPEKVDIETPLKLLQQELQKEFKEAIDNLPRTRGGGGAHALKELKKDVVITNPVDGEALIYDAALGKWVNQSGLVTPANGGFGISQLKTDVATAATINNQAVATGWLNFTGSTATSLTGLAAGTDGMEIILTNYSTANITIENESGSSTAANRFSIGGSQILQPNDGLRFKYNATAQRWVLANKSIWTDNFYLNKALSYLGIGTTANPKAPLHGKQNNTYALTQASNSLTAVATVAPNLAQSAATAVAVSIGNITSISDTQNVGSPSYLVTDGSTVQFQFYAYRTIDGVKYFSGISNYDFTDPINNGGVDYYTLTFTWSAVGSPDGYFVVDNYTNNTWDLGNNTSATFDGGASYTWDVGSQTYDYIIEGYSSSGSTRAFTAYSYGNDPSGVSVRYYTPTVQNLTVTEPSSGIYYIVTLNQGTLVSNATGVKFLDGTYAIEGITTNTNVYPNYWSTNNQGTTITPTTYGILSTGQTIRFQQYARATFPNIGGTPFELYASPGQFADVTLANDGQYRYITFGTWAVATSNMPSDTNTVYGYKIKRTISGVNTYKNTSTFSTFASAPTSIIITNNTTWADSSTISPQTFIPQSGLLESAANANPVSSPNALTQFTLKSTITNGLSGLRITDSTDLAKALFYNYAGITNLRFDANGWKIGNLSGTDWGFFNGSSGNFALGSLNAQAKFNVTATGEMFRFKYDESNYVTGTVSATGNINLTGAGSNTGFTLQRKLDIQSSLQVDSIVNDTGLAHGTYTPTLTNTTNVSASTARQATYMRVGNTVTVAGQLDIDPTTTLVATVLGVSLPVASNFSTAYQCGGTGKAILTTNAIAIEGDATNDQALFKFTPVDVTNQTFTYTFTYQVI